MKSVEYVASQKGIVNTTHSSRDESIRIVANYLRGDIISQTQMLPQLEWPPTIAQLCVDERKPPQSVTFFLENLLNLKGNIAEKANISRIVD